MSGCASSRQRRCTVFLARSTVPSRVTSSPRSSSTRTYTLCSLGGVGSSVMLIPTPPLRPWYLFTRALYCWK